MHAHQIDVSDDDVRRLIGTQFPQWAHERVRRVPSYGTTNAMFRLGADKVVRLPFIPGDGVGVPVETAILERVSGQLPVAIPAVLANGRADECYPYTWSVLGWVEGEMPVPEALVDATGLVDDLVAVLARLRELPTEGVRLAQRSGPLAPLAEPVREAMRELDGEFDTDALRRLWDDALAAPEWAAEPVWLHADLLPSNLLVDEHGRLAGVLDWAAAGIGDPSCELLAAWNVFPSGAREVFRARLAERLDLDDATWRRGRGWAIAQAVLALPYYRGTNAGMVEMATRALRALEQVPADHR
ncbi:aminoglycoside phosphotransferase family protein [Gryllotalpicola protaetiae]|uniref:Aminoglycoside phosphotransferase family protein n=2 Tax=Gryllotalpicola protaetiae TaxID=2419771 RepID=A0A387C3U1_9MICO|nr:aminoglycoside phosphotransferase family protein [Gryllotalpicola protaetiae]